MIGDDVPALYRDIGLVVVAVVLLVAPVWVPHLHLDDPVYRYESVGIETEGTQLAFAEDPERADLGISDRIVCAEGVVGWTRSCHFEHYLAANNGTNLSAGSPDAVVPDRAGIDERYRYVLINGTVHETVLLPNRSPSPAGNWLGLDLGLRPVTADQALDRVSVPIDDLPPGVRTAAQTGSGTGRVADEDLPATPIEVTDGTYRRVYVVNTTSPPGYRSGTEALLRWGGGLTGLVLLGWLWTRFELTVTVSHASDR